MSTTTHPRPSLSISPAMGTAPTQQAKGQYRAPQSRSGARGLAAMLLAGGVAALVVLADQLISTWADGHLLLAWVMLWVVVFAGLALMADSARAMARRMTVSLDAWSRARAEARAEARFLDAARDDPRLMAEWMAARQRSRADDGDYAGALAPLGVEAGAALVGAQPARSGWERYCEQLVEVRSRNIHRYYI